MNRGAQGPDASRDERSAAAVSVFSDSVNPADTASLRGDAIPGLSPQRREGPSLKRRLAFGLLLVSLMAAAGLMGKKLLWEKSRDGEVVKAPDVASVGAGKLRLLNSKGTMPSAAMPASSAGGDGGANRMPGTRVPALKPDGEPQAIGVVSNGNAEPGRATIPAGQQGRPAANATDAPMFSGQARSAGSAKNGKPAANSDEEELEDSLSKTLAALAQKKAQMEAMLARQQGAQGAPATGLFAATPGTSEPALPGFAGLTAAQAATIGRGLGVSGTNTGNGASITNGGGLDSANNQLLGTLEHSATPRVRAQPMLQRTLTIPKGTLFSCALKTRVVTATSGLVGCLVQRDVYGHDGKVVLVERGSHLDGEYRMLAVRPGLTRIPVVWTRVLTPHGITVDLESPATGQLGESGLGGYVDNRWLERIGASLLVSLLDDALKLAVSSNNTGSTVVLSSTTAQGSKLAEEILKSTINIPPLLYANQGGVVGVYVARDLDFSGVYRLQPQ